MNDNNGPAQTGKVLVVDDEEAVRFFLTEALLREGYQVSEAGSGEAALTLMDDDPHHVMVLDLRMPGIDGVTVMQTVFAEWPLTKIIIMTAYASLESAIAAVRSGAFNYLRKPCDTQEVVDVVGEAWQAYQRQLTEEKPAANKAAFSRPTLVQTGDLLIDLDAYTVHREKEPISLTPTEFAILACLAETPGSPVSVSHLIITCLGYDAADPQAQETLRVHISRMRSKLDARYILTVRGGGYLLANIQT